MQSLSAIIIMSVLLIGCGESKEEKLKREHDKELAKNWAISDSLSEEIARYPDLRFVALLSLKYQTTPGNVIAIISGYREKKLEKSGDVFSDLVHLGRPAIEKKKQILMSVQIISGMSEDMSKRYLVSEETIASIIIDYITLTGDKPEEEDSQLYELLKNNKGGSEEQE